MPTLTTVKLTKAPSDEKAYVYPWPAKRFVTETGENINITAVPGGWLYNGVFVKDPRERGDHALNAIALDKLLWETE